MNNQDSKKKLISDLENVASLDEFSNHLKTFIPTLSDFYALGDSTFEKLLVSTEQKFGLEGVEIIQAYTWQLHHG